MAEKAGCSDLRLPPFHCILNLIKNGAQSVKISHALLGIYKLAIKSCGINLESI